ncbi:MAG TPA: transcriptional regulator MntR [Bacilli bacterium]|nr:transcriptional regulator MntR [Bacilli bacterium]
MLTSSMEDYLEKIYELMKEKGYARVSDIASSLSVQPSSVTKMIQKLDEKKLVTYEKYRGIVLTPKGEALGRKMKQRHKRLEEFLRMLGVSEETIQNDVEGIEHHVSPSTMDALHHLVLFFEQNGECLDEFNAFSQELHRNETEPNES